jgi:hypothetical protein
MNKSIIRNDNDKQENQFEYFPPDRQADVQINSIYLVGNDYELSNNHRI